MLAAICKKLGLEEVDNPERADLLQPTKAEVVLEQLAQAEQNQAADEDAAGKS